MNELPDPQTSSSVESPPTAVKPKSNALLPLVQYYFVQATNVLLHPQHFFDTMPREGGYMEPAIFLCFSALFYAVLQAIGFLQPFVVFKLFFNSVFKTALAAFLVGFILKKLGGKGSLESTFRVYCYSKATLLFAWIALGTLSIGGYISLLYTVWMNVYGCSKVHELSKVKVAAVVVVLALFLFLFRV